MKALGFYAIFWAGCAWGFVWSGRVSTALAFVGMAAVSGAVYLWKRLNLKVVRGKRGGVA